MGNTTPLSEEQIQQNLRNDEAEAEAKRIKDAETERLEKIKKGIPPIDFVRRIKKPGVYSAQIFGRRIIIKDRQHFIAKTKAEVKFFNEDPEMEVFNPGMPNKKKKEENKK